VTVKLIPVPAHRRFEALSVPTLESGTEALRRVLQRGIRPSVVRLYDAEASEGSLSRVVGETLTSPTLLLAFEGEPAVVDAEADTTLAMLEAVGAGRLAPALCETWWNRRYDFYHAPHYPTLPSMWGTIDAVASYSRILDVYHAVRAALERFSDTGLALKTHFSHWYEWGSMVYPRFIIPDISNVSDPMKLYKEVWKAGIEAILDAGGVMNDHHGVGSTLAPYVSRQWGPAYQTLLDVKRALDPANILNPGKLGFPLERAADAAPA
jgi:alkyldihydroxyacetonephosphate synthase